MLLLLVVVVVVVVVVENIFSAQEFSGQGSVKKVCLCSTQQPPEVETDGPRAAAAATAKSLQSCPTLCDPVDAAHQAPPSLGFSRQEHWSGLPLPSPAHESEKSSRSVVSFSWRPMDCSLPRSSVHGIFQASCAQVGCHCLLQGIFLSQG